MAMARFLDRMCLALRASGLWLRYAALQNLIPSSPWIAPLALHPGAIQGKEGIKFCHLATLSRETMERRRRFGGRDSSAKYRTTYSAQLSAARALFQLGRRRHEQRLLAGPRAFRFARVWLSVRFAETDDF